MRKTEEEEGRGGEVKKRLKSVRKRKQARRGFGCEVAFKMRLVKAKEENDG